MFITSQMRWLFVGEALVLRKEQRILAFLVLNPPGIAFLCTLNGNFFPAEIADLCYNECPKKDTLIWRARIGHLQSVLS